MITDQGQNDTLGNDAQESTVGQKEGSTKRQRVQVDITKVNKAKEAASGSYKAFASIDWNTFAMAKTFVERTKGSLIYIRHEEDNRGSGNMYVYHENRWRQDNNCEIVKVIYTRTMTAFFEPTISIVDRYVLLLQQLEVDATNEEIKNKKNDAYHIHNTIHYTIFTVFMNILPSFTFASLANYSKISLF